ncbi:MAG: ABC transporter permease [Proteobacteria bacterium]|nr:ABC transporter permease [Pseudomonadota bacterium]
MQGLKAIIKKELSDHISSYRFTIIFALIAMVSLITVYMTGINIRKELEGVTKPQFVFLMLFTSSGGFFSVVQFTAFFGPLMGLLLGFDTINRERNEGTLSKILSQPVYRDTVINSKFLAGVSVISIMMVSIVLVIIGLGLFSLGIVPGIEEIWRILIYLLISIIYISFWLGISILFSILFRSTATSALAALAMWIFFSFFVSIGVSVIVDAIMPEKTVAAHEADYSRPNGINRADFERSNKIKQFSLISPMYLYTDATATIIDPTRKTTQAFIELRPMERISISRFSGPLPLIQSLLIVVPYIVTLLALTIITFAVSYTIFMRQEIRSL